MRLAWFSPLPPTPSGIAAYSAELVPVLATRGFEIDTFCETNAHDFVWQHRRRPYDLTVFQLGNAHHHDYQWAYLFRYPGLVVLHDAQLHQARALFLTKRWRPRAADYLAEVHANHPDAPADLPYLVLARMGDRLYQHWPMVRLVIERARMTLVHNQWLAAQLRDVHPGATIRAIEMGVAAAPDAGSSSAVRDRYGIADDAIVIAAFGGVTPEKRIAQIIRAMGGLGARHPDMHLLLVGARAAHYDVGTDAEAAGLEGRVHVTGYVPDEELSAHLRAADVCACLRWPTNRETSASWLRCIAAARPTLVTELAHLGDLPTLDPRGWRLLDATHPPREPIAVSIDLLDEDHSLQLALDRLVTDGALRARLGRAAYAWWQAHHQLAAMASSYEELLRAALRAPAGAGVLPPHLVDAGEAQLRRLAADQDVLGHVRDVL